MAGEIRLVLYLSFIVAHFNYCFETWHFCSKGATEKLEKINERAIRFVFRDKHTKYEEPLRQLQSQTKIVGTLPLNAVFFSLLARLLVLPMLFVAVNSPNLKRRHWEGKKTASVPIISTETVFKQEF